MSTGVSYVRCLCFVRHFLLRNSDFCTSRYFDMTDGTNLGVLVFSATIGSVEEPTDVFWRAASRDAAKSLRIRIFRNHPWKRAKLRRNCLSTINRCGRHLCHSHFMQVCRYAAAPGGCKKGPACTRDHTVGLLAATYGVCIDFLNGKCTDPAACRLSHTPMSGYPRATAPAATAASAAAHASGAAAGHGSAKKVSQAARHGLSTAA